LQQTILHQDGYDGSLETLGAKFRFIDVSQKNTRTILHPSGFGNHGAEHEMSPTGV
jgi:hypothetical protein